MIYDFYLTYFLSASKWLDIKVHNRLDSDKWEAIVFRVTSLWLTGGPCWSLDRAGWTAYGFQEGQKRFTYTTTLSGCNLKSTHSTRTGVVILFNYSRTRSGKTYVLHSNMFVDAFAKLRKATISFVMSVRPSVPPHRTTRLPMDGFSWNLIFECFLKIAEKIQSDKNNGYFTWVPIYIFDHNAHFFLEWEKFPKKVVDKIKTYISYLINIYFSKIVPFTR
jgi:hypothetical protein